MDGLEEGSGRWYKRKPNMIAIGQGMRFKTALFGLGLMSWLEVNC